MTRRIRALSVVTKIRNQEKRDAQTGLIAARQQEDRASASLTYATDILVEERHIATAGNATMDDFRVWFPSGLERVKQAEEACRIAHAATVHARALALETALKHKATETAFLRLEKERNDSHRRREQAELDEIALHAR